MKIKKSRIKEIISTVIQEEKDYKEFFKRALEKTGKTIPQMSDEEKKKFFNKVDAAWNAKKEKGVDGPATAKGRSDYKEFFRKELQKTGKTIEDMSDEEKKEFFNRIDKKWKADNESIDEATNAYDVYVKHFNSGKFKGKFVIGFESPKAQKWAKSKGVENTDDRDNPIIDGDLKKVEKVKKKLKQLGFAIDNYYFEGKNENINEDTMDKLMSGGMKTWWKYPKEDVMSFVYFLQRQVPPSNEKKFEQEWKNVAKQLQKKFPAPKDVYKDLLGEIKVNEEVSVFDERRYGKNGIIIMIDDNGKKTSAIFKNKKNADKYNRNNPADVKKLLALAKKTKYPNAIDEIVKEASTKDFYDARVKAKVQGHTFIGDVVRYEDGKLKVDLGGSKFIMVDPKDAKKVSKSKKRTYESVKKLATESFSSSELSKIKQIVSKQKKLIGLTPHLKKAGFKDVDFVMLDGIPPHIKIKKGKDTFLLVNKNYVDDPDFVVGDIAGGLDEVALKEAYVKDAKYSKNGYVKRLVNSKGKLAKSVKVDGKEYKYNSVYKTYNSVKGNELLHKSDVEKAKVALPENKIKPLK